MRRLIPAILLACCGAFALSAQAAVKRIPAPNAATPYSSATVAGDFIYVTGTGGGNATEIGAATNQALDNIAAVLKKAGADLGDVVQTQVFLTDRANAGGMDTAYAARFSKNPPARTVVVTCLVGCRGLVEINAIAVRHGVAHRAILPKGWQKPDGFSYAQKAGNTLYISALDGSNPMDGSAATAGNVGVQTKAIMDNLGTLLKAGGMDYGDIAAGRVWMAEMGAKYAGMNAVYRTYFTGDYPSRATLAFGMVKPEDITMISAVAVKGGPRKVIAAAIPAEGQEAPKPNPNFSAGMVVGNRMWVTGTTGSTKDNKGDIGAQAKETLAKLLRVLKAGGFTQDQVVEINCFVTDLKDPKTFAAMNAGYKEVFDKNLPARTTVQGENAGSRGGAMVEITMMAAR